MTPRTPYIVKVVTTIEREVVIYEHSKAAAIRSAQQLADERAFDIYADTRRNRCTVVREATKDDLKGTHNDIL